MRSAFRILIVLMIVLIAPWCVTAESGTLSTEDTLKQLILIVSQYDTRIKSLESENALLRNEMMKAGIKIPLSQYSGSLTQSTVSPTIPSTYLTGILAQSGVSMSTGAVLTSTSTLLDQVKWQYGSDVAGFIGRIQKEWRDIRVTYHLPEGARIGGYEFVQKDANDHVFVDIIYGSGMSTGIYDAKILYQYEKSEYKRKLIGYFVYDTSTQRYLTKSGNNPFSGVTRYFVRDPFALWVIALPSTATTTTQTLTGSSLPTTPSTGSTDALTNTNVSYADIEKAYSDKRYLSVISLSNGYLTNNAPTYELLRIRYRTYFIIGKYTESLSEIAKIQSLGKLDKQTACDAQVIATYGKDSSLVTKYTALCK